jgi:hypothetical protein
MLLDYFSGLQYCASHTGKLAHSAAIARAKRVATKETLHNPYDEVYGTDNRR